MRVSYEIWLERGNLSFAFVVEIFSFRTFLAILCPWTKTRWPYRSHCFMDCSSIWLTSSQKKTTIIIIPVFEVPLNFTFRFCSFSHIFNRWTLMERGNATHHYTSTLYKTMDMTEALQRQEADGTPLPQGQAVGGSFPIDQNSKMRKQNN